MKSITKGLESLEGKLKGKWFTSLKVTAHDLDGWFP